MGAGRWRQDAQGSSQDGNTAWPSGINLGAHEEVSLFGGLPSGGSGLFIEPFRLKSVLQTLGAQLSTQLLNQRLHLFKFGRSRRAKFKQRHLNRRYYRSRLRHLVDRQLTIPVQPGRNRIAQQMYLIPVLQKVVRRLADADVRFNGA